MTELSLEEGVALQFTILTFLNQFRKIERCNEYFHFYRITLRELLCNSHKN